MIKKLGKLIHEAFERNRFITGYKNTVNLQGKINMQLMTSGAFLVLAFVNLFSKSYPMLALTATGFVVNFVFAIAAKWRKSSSMCAISSIATCSVLFGSFVIYGGNDGFACLWIILIPLLAMVAMDFIIGFFTGIFIQIYLIVVFWTPVREMLPYRYNDEFCKRFPLLFLVSFLLGFILTVSLQKSEYNEYKNLLKLQEMTTASSVLARTDPLTQLSNRRFAYEEFDAKYSAENEAHCIVMGDIDSFKKVNDTYGHKFGDDVLIIVAGYMRDILPSDYLKSRWGGEEFLFAANASVNEVYLKVENLRTAIAAHEFYYCGTPVHITITFGIAGYSGKSGLAKAISTADNRMYNGKITTKNCTVTEG